MSERWPERWVPVLGSPKYEVSDLGRVRSNIRTPGRLLTPAANDCGYLKLGLGRGRQVYVHRIVIYSHVGPPPEDGEAWTVDHIDFDLTNNRLDNLRYLTLEENSARHADAELEAWWGQQRHRSRRRDGSPIEPRAVA